MKWFSRVKNSNSISNRSFFVQLSVRRWLPWVVLGLWGVLCLFSWWQIHVLFNKNRLLRAENDLNRLVERFHEKLNVFSFFLTSLQNLFSASEKVTPQEWRIFCRGFIERFNHSEIEAVFLAQKTGTSSAFEWRFPYRFVQEESSFLLSPRLMASFRSPADAKAPLPVFQVLPPEFFSKPKALLLYPFQDRKDSWIGCSIDMEKLLKTFRFALPHGADFALHFQDHAPIRVGDSFSKPSATYFRPVTVARQIGSAFLEVDASYAGAESFSQWLFLFAGLLGEDFFSLASKRSEKNSSRPPGEPIRIGRSSTPIHRHEPFVHRGTLVRFPRISRRNPSLDVWQGAGGSRRRPSTISWKKGARLGRNASRLFRDASGSSRRRPAFPIVSKSLLRFLCLPASEGRSPDRGLRRHGRKGTAGKTRPRLGNLEKTRERVERTYGTERRFSFHDFPRTAHAAHGDSRLFKTLGRRRRR